MTLLAPDKTALRRDGLARRDALAPGLRAASSDAIVRTVLALPEIAGARVVAGYVPLRSEVDIRPALAALADRGVRIVLPAVMEDGLVFRVHEPGAALVRGAFGVAAPGPDAQTARPDVLLVPLARFDAAGNRIGYGKGHYDRAFAALEREAAVCGIGIAFAVQETETIPAEDHDRPLDLVVTEKGVVRPSRGGDATRGRSRAHAAPVSG